MLSWIGPLGGLLPMRSMPPGIEASRPGRVSRRQALDGSVAAQVLPMSQREYAWTLTQADSDDIRHLYALYQGVHGAGPFWLYDALAAGRNMLSPSVATPGLRAEHGWSQFAAGPEPSAPVRGVLSVEGGVRSPAYPVPPDASGRTFTASIENTQTADPVDLILVGRDVDGTFVEVIAETTVGPNSRESVTGAPSSAQTVQVGINLESESLVLVTRPQLTETDAPIDWFAGVGIPQVVVAELGETYQAAWRQQGVYRGDYAVRLVEIGAP